MFRAHSPYSPFFTSGLLSEPISARRNVFQTDNRSTVYFDIVFNDDDHYRSFLSLDLAETQSIRSLSLKRKASSKYTARSRHKFDTISESPSRDSLRSMPSPKPIPSITLPLPPTRSVRSPVPTIPPRLPSFPPLPSLEFDIPTSPKRKSVSSKKHSIASTKSPSVRSPTRQSSTVSARTRLRNRATALALLEGRQQPAVPLPPRPCQELKNFMSMSDDEDEDEIGIVPNSDHQDGFASFFDPSFEPEDVVLPASPGLSLPPSRVLHPTNGDKHPKSGGRKISQRRVKHKFPLKSFIDLYNENDDDSGNPNWNWRSFIEITNVS